MANGGASTSRDPESFATVERFIRGYSGLHDADIVRLHIDAVDRRATLLVAAQRYETGADRMLEVIVSALTRFSFTCSEPDSDDVFSEYRFPANRLVDGVEIDPHACSIRVRGTYGWMLELSGDSAAATEVISEA